PVRWPPAPILAREGSPRHQAALCKLCWARYLGIRLRAESPARFRSDSSEATRTGSRVIPDLRGGGGSLDHDRERDQLAARRLLAVRPSRAASIPGAPAPPLLAPAIRRKAGPDTTTRGSTRTTAAGSPRGHGPAHGFGRAGGSLPVRRHRLEQR